MEKNDTIAHVHYDSICDDGHIIEIDTTYVVDENNDTIVVIDHIEKTIEKKIEKQIIEKLLEDQDYGTGIISVLILAFAVIAILKRWKRK